MFWKKKKQAPQLDEMGRDPAWYAAMDGDNILLQERLDAGLDVNHAGTDGMTMLFVATHYGHRNIVQVLIGRGAEVDKAEKKHLNAPLWEATREACTMPSASEYDAGIIADLLAAGADPERINKVGRSAVGWADGDDDARKAVQKSSGSMVLAASFCGNKNWWGCFVTLPSSPVAP